MGKMIMALKKLANKLNGKAPESDNVVGVINGMADDYEAPDLTPYATKVYVDGLMSGALKRDIVQALPEEDIDTNTIYMVLDITASQGNVYNEYLYINNAWELIGTTATSGAGVEFIEIESSATSIDEETLEKLVDFNTPNETPKPTFIILKLPKGTKEVNPILMPSGNGHMVMVYRSAVISGKYYQLTVDYSEVEEGADVSIEQISIGGGGGSLKLATIYYSGTEDYSYSSSLTLLIDASISTPTTYEELVNYLRELGFNDYSNVYPCSGMFNDDGPAGVIVGITEEDNWVEEEPVDMLKVYGVVRDSEKETFLNNDENFSITYLGQEQGE